MFDIQRTEFVLTLFGTGCWAACFWWMHRISLRQEKMLRELHAVTERIEKLARAEHDLIREVHPKIGDIHESVEEVAEAVAHAR